jgi:carboxyl-terminal processing protease
MRHTKNITSPRDESFVGLSILAAVIFAAHAFAPHVSSKADFDSAPISTATREGRLAVFDDAWSTINQRYYDRAFNGIDWEHQRIVFRALAADSTSATELYAVLRRMIGVLNDPHTRIFSPDEKFDWWRPRLVTIGLALREVDGLPTVVYVEKGSAPDRAGVRVGDVIERVDGESALSLISKRIERVTPNIPSARFRAFASLMDGPAGTTVTLDWKRKDGKTRTDTFQRYWQQRELGMRMRKQGGNILVIEIDAFTKPIVASFASVLRQKLNGARGIVLDLRGNGGGDAEAMTEIASAFLDNGFDLGRFTDRIGSSFDISTRTRSVLLSERIASTKLPVVILASERTSSAAEILISAFKTTHRARIIGTQTCGCVLAIRNRHLLPDGGLLDVSELDYQTANGDRLERHGITPDESVVVARTDLYAGHDRAMTTALHYLSTSRQHPAN